MSEDQVDKATAAVRTLEGIGYTYSGGALWRPPLGPRPNFRLIDAKNAEIERLRELLRRELTPQRFHDAVGD